MTQSEFLTESKLLLLSIKKSRKWLLQHNKSKLPISSSSQTELKNLEYAISTITDATRMKDYIQRKKDILFTLTNSKHKKQHAQLKKLIECQLD
jgi:uncharacterized protein YbgA (DUF1722 family)